MSEKWRVRFTSTVISTREVDVRADSEEEAVQAVLAYAISEDDGYEVGALSWTVDNVRCEGEIK